MWTWAFLFPLASLAEFISSLIFTLHPCLSEFLLICWLHHLLTLHSRATNLMSVCLRNFISSFVRLILTKCFCSLLQNWVPQLEFFSFTRLKSHLWASRALCTSCMLMSLWTVIANSTDVCFISYIPPEEDTVSTFLITPNLQESPDQVSINEYFLNEWVTRSALV